MALGQLLIEHDLASLPGRDRRRAPARLQGAARKTDRLERIGRLDGSLIERQGNGPRDEANDLEHRDVGIRCNAYRRRFIGQVQGCAEDHLRVRVPFDDMCCGGNEGQSAVESHHEPGSFLL